MVRIPSYVGQITGIYGQITGIYGQILGRVAGLSRFR